MNRSIRLAMLTLATATTLAQADVTLPTVISSGMVLQRDRTLPIWGTADAGEAVTVTFAGQTKNAIADASGKWRVDLAPLTASETPQSLVVRGKNTLTLDDVLVGDVWLCGGQSNMDRPIRTVDGADEVAAMKPVPTLRLFKVEKQATTRPAATLQGKWLVADGKSAVEFSGVGFYFGREVHREVGVPVGLIHSAWGGTPAEAWISEAALANPELKSVRDRDDAKEQASAADQKRYDAAMARFETTLKAWRANRTAEGADAASERPKPPTRPPSLIESKRAERLYNGMIAPLAPYALRGTIWYQGEANSPFGLEYRKLLPALIANWRETFESPQMPFGVVQLANFNPVRAEGPTAWTELREAQLLTQQADKNVGLAVTIDVGDPNDIHPTDKLTVGKRLARWAMATAYGKSVEWQGPTLATKTFDGNTARLTFDHANGMAGRGGSTDVEGFEVAGDDKVFAPAKARVDGNTIVITSEKPIVAVRYAWAKNPKATLVNGEGLPASPFRTDDWPLPPSPRQRANAEGDGQ